MPVVNVNEAIQRLRKAGSTKVRTCPMPGQDVHEGQYQVEVLEEGQWVPVVSGIPRTTANDLVKQSLNRVLLG